ncbi:Ycf51 family protein [Calothrix sp. UHCC 0171]|uniref:Ycf51 family protein n=1 Tax=Calothrix sp. UHCC 0171 TaxID=3110245 RepID=UPI002B20F0CC|nr:Ycf51 family protein [Calothrix sp. UHCC 0171]MEA5571468.1 Ycf51 family protein [Calothrix sp. UHCC 0171]
MDIQLDFLKYTQWSGIATLAFAAIAILGFVLKWGIRFRLVGTTGFMLVVTAGLFALSLAPLMRTEIPGAIHYSRIYDNGATQVVIALPQTVTPTQLDATLRQAASDLYSYGRLGAGGNGNLTIRARTVIHPEDGLSVPLFLGQVQRSLSSREDAAMAIEIYEDKFAQLGNSRAS